MKQAKAVKIEIDYKNLNPRIKHEMMDEKLRNRLACFSLTPNKIINLKNKKVLIDN